MLREKLARGWLCLQLGGKQGEGGTPLGSLVMDLTSFAGSLAERLLAGCLKGPWQNNNPSSHAGGLWNTEQAKQRS